MCGRFTLRTPMPVLVREFQLASAPELRPRYNIAPTQDVPVVRFDDGHRHLIPMRWGLIPSWAKDAKIGNRLLNARSETAATKPSFRAAMKRRRCLVLADGYYEWRREGRRKQPYWIRMADDAPFAMAGLWEVWTGIETDGAPWLTCTILTTTANELTESIHDRMPVILTPQDTSSWLGHEPLSEELREDLLQPFDPDAMQMEAVSTYVNNACHEGPACVAPESE